MLAHMVNSDGRLVRNWLVTTSAIPAFAEDYAAFTATLSDMTEEESLAETEQLL